MTRPMLTPRLIVRDVDAAIAFYQSTLGARTLERYHDARLDLVVHASLAVGDAVLSLAQHAPDWHNHAPEPHGSPVLLQLEVDDPDATAARMVDAGAEVVFEIADQFYGKREGRLRNPFGHVWILSKEIETLSPEEIQRRVDSFHD